MDELTNTLGATLEINLPSSLQADSAPTGGGVSSSFPSPLVPAAGGPGGHGERSGGRERGALDLYEVYADQRELKTRSKRRSAAYFELQTGSRYQERLCHLVLGMKRGSLKNYDIAVKRLMRFIRKQTGINPEYHQTRVIDEKDGQIRIHGHFLINMPFIPQYLLLDEWQGYLDEQASLFIKHIPDGKSRKREIKYALQYNLKQKGIIRYSKSTGWLPPGAKREWKFMKRAIKRQELHILDSPEWRAAMIQSFHTWIDEQRRTRQQYALY